MVANEGREGGLRGGSVGEREGVLERGRQCWREGGSVGEREGGEG